MGDVIQFKPVKTDSRKSILNGKVNIIQFPNVNEYIQLYELFLEGKTTQKAIYDAFLKVNETVSDLPDAYDKKVQICKFVDYFIDSISDDLLTEIVDKYEGEPTVFHLYGTFQEDEIIDAGMTLLYDIDENFVDVFNKIVSYICINMKNETLVEFISADNEFRYQIELDKRGLETQTVRKAQILLSLFARSHFGDGVFFIHELKNNKEYVSGLVVNEEGVFSINKTDLIKAVRKRNVVYTELDLHSILYD